MKKSEIEYMNTLVERFKGYKSPTDTQLLIIELAERGDARTRDENKMLETLLKAEKQADKLAQARAEARNVLDAKKRAEKRADNQRKIIWGATLRHGAKSDKTLFNAVKKLWEGGYISDDDKKLLRNDYDEIMNTAGDELPLPPEPDDVL